MLTQEQFQKILREALNHLHAPDRLAKSPLVALLGVENQPDTYSALQRTLSEAIASLEPKADVPSRSRAWRIYDLLSCRYVQELSVPVVAQQLGVSTRHLRREQRAALEALAYRLWEQFDLETRFGERAERVKADRDTYLEADRDAHVGAGRDPPRWDAAAGPSIREELAWLKDIPLDMPTELDRTLSEVLELLRPLADQHQAHLDVTVAEDLPDLAVHPAAARHLLLHLLSMVLPRAAGGRVCVSARPLCWNVEVQVHGEAGNEARPARADQASLDMAYQLAELCAGELHLAMGGTTTEVALTLPALEQLPVLAIDDNADTLQLLRRFTAGTRYRLVGTRAPEQGLELAAQCHPQVIVLDVMMPRVDGWKVLAQLRQHPLTCDIPIVICTILPQQSLAFSLGASGFVRKPLTQQSFLAALDHQVAQRGTGRC